jgi:GNAT superfamily N-acetyltransferase
LGRLSSCSAPRLRRHCNSGSPAADAAALHALPRRELQRQSGLHSESPEAFRESHLSVHPAHRGAGLATTLLQSTFSLGAEQGLREAQLGVASDNPRVLLLYERWDDAAFRFDTFERPVEDAMP